MPKHAAWGITSAIRGGTLAWGSRTGRLGGMTQYRRLAAVLAVAAAAGTARAQDLVIGDPLVDYARLLQLTGALPPTLEGVGRSGRLVGEGDPPADDPWRDARRSRGGLGWATGPELQLRILPAEFRLGANSARPWGTNDGAVWQGRGATVAASGGASLRWGPVTAAFQPTVFRAANRAFALSPIAVHADLSPWTYPTGLGQSIDMPQRFGDEPVETFDLGQSFVRADLGPVSLGLSNESLWWGPGRRNAITMTNNAPGFGHAFLGTSGPVDVGIGRLDARWHWGRLRESRFFDADATNDSRYTTGLVASFSPKGAPGLELGATRTFILAWRDGGPDLDDVMLVFIPLEKKRLSTPSNPLGDDATDQMASLFARWAMPEAGFEVYGEWARGDHSWDLRDLFVEPEHASAWLLGFQKAIAGRQERLYRLAGELTILGATRTTLVRAPASAFYVHHIVRQGYTQRGQVMGAGIGPGSSQAYLGLDRFAPWGRVGVGLQRTVYDNNRFYAEPRNFDQHEVEPALLADAVIFRGPWEFSGGFAIAKLMNKHYERRNDETNVNLSLALRYHFASR